MATVRVGGAPRFQPADVSTPILQQTATLQRGLEGLSEIGAQFLASVEKQKTQKAKVDLLKKKALEGIESSSAQIQDPATRDAYKQQYSKLINESTTTKDIGSIAIDAKSVINAIGRRSSINQSVAGAPEPPTGQSIDPAQAQTPAQLTREQITQQTPAPAAPPPPGEEAPETISGKVAFDNIDFSLAGTPGFGNELFERDSANIERWQRSNISQLALEYQETTENPDAEGFRQFVSQQAQKTGQTAFLNEDIINNIGKQFEARGAIEGRALRRETAETAAQARIKAARIAAGRKARREDVVDIEKQKVRFDKMTTEANKLIAGVERSRSRQDMFDALLMDPADRKALLGNRANTLTKAEEKTVVGNLGNQLLIRGQNTGEIITGPEAEDAAKDILDGRADAPTTIELINKLRPDQVDGLIGKFERLSPRAAEALKKIKEPRQEEPQIQRTAPPQREPQAQPKVDLGQFLR